MILIIDLEIERGWRFNDQKIVKRQLFFFLGNIEDICYGKCKKVKRKDNMNHEIKVLFLDIDNTLLDFDAGAAWGMEQCFQKAGLEYRTEMFSVFTEENNKIWQKIERRELTMDNLFYVRWQAILAHLGLQADGVEMEKEFRRLLHLTAVPVEGAKEILEYLYKKDYFLCAASNGPYDQQINRLRSADMLRYFSHCFVSEKIGADKPGKQFFDGCMKEFSGIHPSECMMIGDSLTADIAGGQAYGMSTCWFVHSGDKSMNTRENGGKVADHIIYKLEELKNIL